jgi:antitoxin ParD1/3/4
MPTRNISLTREQDSFIKKAVDSGEYQNASEAGRDALRALQRRRREDALKVKALRAQIKAGIAALERGEFTEVGDADLDDYLERLAGTAGKRTGKRRATNLVRSPPPAGAPRRMRRGVAVERGWGWRS